MRDSTLKLRGLLLRTRSEEWLFERALGGDPVAFSEVFRRYHKLIYGFCLSRLLDHSAAEEAAQETFVRFLNADATSVKSARAWLFGVAKNVCLETHRSRNRTDPFDDVDVDLRTSADSEEELQRRQQGRNIILALRRMRPRYRTALVLRELHGLSSAEIADSLESTPGAVDTLISRARDAFGKAYAEVCDLPSGCAETFPLIYKRSGSGLDELELAKLESHLESCPNCRRELEWADKKQMLASVLPLVTAIGTRDEPARLAQLLANLDPTFAAAPYASLPATQHIWVKSVATVALAAAVVLPGAATVVEFEPVQKPVAAVPTANEDHPVAAKPARKGGGQSASGSTGAWSLRRRNMPAAVSLLIDRDATRKNRQSLVKAARSDEMVKRVPVGAGVNAEGKTKTAKSAASRDGGPRLIPASYRRTVPGSAKRALGRAVGAKAPGVTKARSSKARGARVSAAKKLVHRRGFRRR